MRANVSQISSDIREMYHQEDEKRLLQRIREKFYRIKYSISTEKDSDIRQCLQDIVNMEKRNSSTVNSPCVSSPSTDTTGSRNPGESTSTSSTRPPTSSLGNPRSSTSSMSRPECNLNDEDTEEDMDEQDKDIRLQWAREDAVQCERVKKRKRSEQKKQKKKSRSTKELIRENEKLKNKLLTYLCKNKYKLVGVSSE